MNRLNTTPHCEGCTYKSLLFESLPKESLGKISECKAQYEFKKGDRIIREGDEINSIVYLQKGLIKLYKDISNGKTQIISIAKPFEFVGLLSVFSNETYIYSISAIEDSYICFIDMNCIQNEIQNNGAFAFDIIKKMSKITDDVINSKFELSKKNLRGRIAFILLDFAQHIYKNNEFELPVSRREIADLIDMRTENVIRIFSEFRKDKIIRINGPVIEIINMELLEKICLAG